jgi:pimeloyl-ACP methyl ester carboxylesterase
MTLPDPVIIIPGITANYLSDHYPLPPEDVWTVLNLNFKRAALHPDNPAYEAMEPAAVRPGQLYEVAYKELIDELRYELSPNANSPVPVFPFSYDWRQPLETSEEALAAFVKEVVARTSLLTHYVRDGYKNRRTVTLVGHSMGGLIVGGYLEKYRDKSCVAKVVTLATPYCGSFEAVIKVTTGTANLGVKPPSSSEREAARITPALYYLTPDFKDGLTIHDPNLPRTLFDPGLWQPSVVGSIEGFIRDYGTDPNDIPGQARALFQRMLQAAKAHRDRIANFQLAQAGLTANEWLCVVGVGSTTRVRLEVVRAPDGAPDFQFHSSDRDDQWASQNQAQRIFTGDGTVPFDGALPPFLARENLVCVTPDDYGYWEIGDKVLTTVAGFHGILPNMDMLHRLVVRHITGVADTHGNTWGRRAPGVVNWQPPIPLTEKI